MGKYKYYRSSMGGDIIIENDRGERRAWGVDALRIIEKSTGIADPIRDMAREALLEFGLLEERQEEEPSSDTIATIEAIPGIKKAKIYQGLFTRAFFTIWKGTRLYGSLSDLEKKIKRGV